MKKYNLKHYQDIFVHTCEIYRWKPIVNDANDEKLLDILFFGELPKISTGKKPMTMMSIIYIMWGKSNLEQTLEKGLVD